MDISVIIVNYNTCALTKQCIDSIFEHTKDVKFEVILVDNASVDGSVECFNQDNRITFVESGGNIGFGRANNLGYEHATGKYIFLLNSDTKLLNNALKIFFDYMEQAPQDIACCGTQLLNSKEERLVGNGAWGGKQTSCYDAITNPYKKLFRLILPFNQDKPVLIPNPPFEVGSIVGADMFIRRSVIEECGMFDPDFFMYGEEVEMNHRFLKAGYRLMIIGGPRIIHFIRASSGQKISPRLLKMQFQGNSLYLKKTNSRLPYLIYRIMTPLRIPFLLSRKFTFKENMSIVKIFFSKV